MLLIVNCFDWMPFDLQIQCPVNMFLHSRKMLSNMSIWYSLAYYPPPPDCEPLINDGKVEIKSDTRIDIVKVVSYNYKPSFAQVCLFFNLAVLGKVVTTPTVISFPDNHFEGTLSLGSIANFSKLQAKFLKSFTKLIGSPCWRFIIEALISIASSDLIPKWRDSLYFQHEAKVPKSRL